MMNIEKLAERLGQEAYGSDIEDLLLDAATAIETLRADLARVTAERDAAQALPCKVGDTVYQVDDIRVYALEVRNLIFDAGILAFDESTIGKTVFLTRAEAEAARREQDGQGGRA